MDYLNTLTEKVPPDWLQQIATWGMRVVGVIVLFIIARIVAGWASRGVERALTTARTEQTLVKFLSKLASWGVMVLAVVMALGTFGIETTSFAAVLGAAGLAIGLAMQGTLSHFAAGVMLLVFRPFKVGDVVQIGGKTGKIDAIDIFFTTLDTFDNRRFILPNGQVFGSPIENITFHPVRRADIQVGTDYGADLVEVRQVLEDAARNVPGRDPERDIMVVLTGLGSSSIDWEVRVWCATPDVLAVQQATRLAVKQALDGAGIGIPFPQMDVHFDAPEEAPKPSPVVTPGPGSADSAA